VAWLGETMTAAKLLGIAFICVGVVLVSRSSV
jgi:drug/metabolite transporter (DMT)-like permease